SPGIDADRPAIARRVIARVFERLPAALQEQALLRVDDRRLGRRKAKKSRVELVDGVHNPRSSDIAGIAEQAARYPSGAQFLLREERNRLDPLAQVAPECFEIR